MNSKKIKFIFLFIIMPVLLLLSLKVLVNNAEKIEREKNDYTKISVEASNPLAKGKTFEDLLNNPDFKTSLEAHLYDYVKDMNMSESSVWYPPLNNLNYDMAYEQSLAEKTKIDNPETFKKIKDKFNTLGVVDSLSPESLGVGDVLDHLNKYYIYGYNEGNIAAKKTYNTYINKSRPERMVNKIDLTNGSQLPQVNNKEKNQPIKMEELFSKDTANNTLKKGVQISYNCYGNKNCYDAAVNTLNFNQKVFLLVFINLSLTADKSKPPVSEKQISELTTKSMIKYLNNDDAKKSIIMSGFMEGYTKNI